jgi:hypothetical protein
LNSWALYENDASGKPEPQAPERELLAVKGTVLESYQLVAPNAAMYASIQIETQGADSAALYLVPVTKADDGLSALQFCIYMVIVGHSPNSAYKFNSA